MVMATESTEPTEIGLHEFRIRKSEGQNNTNILPSSGFCILDSGPCSGPFPPISVFSVYSVAIQTSMVRDLDADLGHIGEPHLAGVFLEARVAPEKGAGHGRGNDQHVEECAADQFADGDGECSQGPDAKYEAGISQHQA